MIDFGAWRNAYDDLSYADHLQIHELLWRFFQDQQHYDVATAQNFLSSIPLLRIVEVGGWHGELAAHVLPNLPACESWVNYEICKSAANHPACRDSRYRALIPPSFLWECERVPLNGLVASHVIEHMRWTQLKKLFRWATNAKAFYLASPLPEDGSAPDWNGYPGTHILEVGWSEIESYLADLGLAELTHFRTHEVRCFASMEVAS